MNETDSDVREYVTRKSAYIRRSAGLRRITSVVDSWNREERGKAKVAIGSLLGFLTLIAVYALLVGLFPGRTFLVLPVGLVVWLAFVGFLMNRFLGKRRHLGPKEEERSNQSLIGYVAAATFLVLALFAVVVAHILWGPKGLLFGLSLWIGGLLGVIMVWWSSRRNAKPNRRF